MPTIEIISLGADKIGLNQDDFQVAIIEDTQMESDRGLFYDYLKPQKGTIVHIGNPDFKMDKEGGFFAGKIIYWDFEPTLVQIPNFDKEETGSNQQFKFQFLVDYQIDVAKILIISLESSPVQEAYFLTDYQFGPEIAKMKDLKISEFWTLHDSKGLTWNTLYKLKK